MRKKIVAGNWKMNKTLPEAIELTKEIKSNIEGKENSDVVVVLAPPSINLSAVSHELNEMTGVHAAAQNCSEHASGAYTGEVSTEMIKSTGAEFVIIGHSERREYFGESNELLAQKTDAVLESGLSPIYCCGEVLEERKSGEYASVIASQVDKGLFHLSAEAIKNVVIAYEPVWAIGTGETASPEQAQEVHQLIRKQLAGKYGDEVAASVSILYGGSVKPANAKELFAQEDIDGGLIGGASLKAADFSAIIDSF